ncbi:hypothetical protein MKY64_30385 [Paenibacillus sp. FSL R7-0210]|uniref:hypothetical protein n=1 Tax=Paenibacillus sp. FSL R7-0210 TaxID=2921676 RepID=UPI0030F59772
MTQRDWQKDEALLQLCQRTATDENEKHTLSIGLHWLQEAKRLEGLATGRGQAIIRKNREISELEARAYSAEDREQRMKEAIELLLFMFRFDPEEGQAYINFGDYEEPLEIDDNSAYITASNIFFTLYPDTPAQPAAPKEGSHEPSEIKRCD